MEDPRPVVLPTIDASKQDVNIEGLGDPLRILARIIARDLAKRKTVRSDLTNEPPSGLLDKDENKGG